jgi:thioredoxin 1
MSKPITVSDAEFEQVVLKSTLPVIVDFWAPWCGPCKMVAPILEDIARQHEGKIIVAKVNTDENQTWMMRYGIQGIPTILFILNGKLVNSQVGAAPAKVLNQKVEALLSAVAA